jgi:hypothetical protein
VCISVISSTGDILSIVNFRGESTVLHIVKVNFDDVCGGYGRSVWKFLNFLDPKNHKKLYYIIRFLPPGKYIAIPLQGPTD